jgi:type II secretory pathway component PulM
MSDKYDPAVQSIEQTRAEVQMERDKISEVIKKARELDNQLCFFEIGGSSTTRKLISSELRQQFDIFKYDAKTGEIGEDYQDVPFAGLRERVKYYVDLYK